MLAREKGDGADVVSKSLLGKATSTVLKRAVSMGKYVTASKSLGFPAFPITAAKLKMLLAPLVNEGKKSALKDAVASVNFAQHVLGFKVEAGTLDNPWIKGVLRQANIRDREPHQSRVISAREVLLLENALIDGKMDRVDRYALGVMLFQLYSRARVSDLRNISKIELDIAGNAGYIEVQTYEHKGRRMTSGPGAALILVAPIQGLSSKPWGTSFVEAARAVGFDFSQSFRGPLLPRLASDYSWSGDAIDAAETTAWLNGILRTLDPAAAEGLTSHGLKATTLSWLWKANCSERTCLILGHHALSGGRKTSASYGRDIQAGPLRDLDRCIQAIKAGTFLPDMTRSGMVREQPEGSPAAVPSALSVALSPPPEPNHAQEAKEAPQELASTESSSSMSSSDSGESEGNLDFDSLCEGTRETLILKASMGVDLVLYQNPKTKSLHARAKGAAQGSKLLCGRSAQDFVLFEGKVFSSHWKCKQCLVARPLKDTGAVNQFLDQRLKRT